MLSDLGSESRKRHKIFVFPKVSDRLRAHPPVQWIPEAPSSEMKRPRREINHSPLSSALVKNEWSYTVTPPLGFQWVERDRFHFLIQ